MEPATLNNQIFQIEHDRSRRLAVQQAQWGGGLQRGSRAALIFNPSHLWGSALAELLGASVGGVAVTGEDIADALKLCALKALAGDKGFVMEALVGQEVLLSRLMHEAAAEYRATERLDFKSKRLAHFLALEKAHLRALSALAAMQGQ